MGYYTSHTLTVNNNQERDIIAQFRNENEHANYALDENGESRQEAKWYNSEKHLKEFSKKYPSVLFTLEGEGEEQGDQWKLYVMNGKSQLTKAVISFEDFDTSKLI